MRIHSITLPLLLQPFYFSFVIFYRTPHNFLLVNLAIADTMYATFIAPEVVLATTGNHPGGVGGTLLCKLVTAGIFAWVGGFSSMVTLVVIAFERYYAVIYPFENKRLTKKKLKVRQCLMLTLVHKCLANMTLSIISNFSVSGSQLKHLISVGLKISSTETETKVFSLII